MPAHDRQGHRRHPLGGRCACGPRGCACIHIHGTASGRRGLPRGRRAYERGSTGRPNGCSWVWPTPSGRIHRDRLSGPDVCLRGPQPGAAAMMVIHDERAFRRAMLARRPRPWRIATSTATGRRPIWSALLRVALRNSHAFNRLNGTFSWLDRQRQRLSHLATGEHPGRQPRTTSRRTTIWATSSSRSSSTSRCCTRAPSSNTSTTPSSGRSGTSSTGSAACCSLGPDDHLLGDRHRLGRAGGRTPPRRTGAGSPRRPSAASSTTAPPTASGRTASATASPCSHRTTAT